MYQYWQFWAFLIVIVAVGIGMWKGFIPNPFKNDDSDSDPDEPPDSTPNSGSVVQETTAPVTEPPDTETR